MKGKKSSITNPSLRSLPHGGDSLSLLPTASQRPLDHLYSKSTLRRGVSVYLNSFTGGATTEFPSTLQMARGGILADSMGLGKTVMTISLLLTHSVRDKSSGGKSTCQPDDVIDSSPNISKKATQGLSVDQLLKKQNKLIYGGNLIVCPMTLLGQWKAEIETHAQAGALSIYAHYGQGRSYDPNIDMLSYILQLMIVIGEFSKILRRIC